MNNIVVGCCVGEVSCDGSVSNNKLLVIQPVERENEKYEVNLETGENKRFCCTKFFHKDEHREEEEEGEDDGDIRMDERVVLFESSFVKDFLEYISDPSKSLMCTFHYDGNLDSILFDDMILVFELHEVQRVSDLNLVIKIQNEFTRLKIYLMRSKLFSRIIQQEEQIRLIGERTQSNRGLIRELSQQTGNDYAEFCREKVENEFVLFSLSRTNSDFIIKDSEDHSKLVFQRNGVFRIQGFFGEDAGCQTALHIDGVDIIRTYTSNLGLFGCKDTQSSFVVLVEAKIGQYLQIWTQSGSKGWDGRNYSRIVIERMKNGTKESEIDPKKKK